MTTSIDTNVIAALWSDRDPFNSAALKVLRQPQLQSDLVIAGAVYAELMAGPLRSEAALDRFLSETGVSVDWVLDEAVWFWMRPSGEKLAVLIVATPSVDT